MGLVAVAGALACGDSTREDIDIVVFSKTAGFRHDSIADGLAMLEDEALERGWRIHATESSPELIDQLDTADVVVFLNTSGDILNDSEQTAFEAWMDDRGNFVGVHAASDTEYEWPWYGELVGAFFDSHPNIQPATVTVDATAHPSTSHLAATWDRTDEWYNFATNPRQDVEVVLSLDEESYQGGTMNGDHPIAWFQETQGRRSFYTALGHTSESYTEPDFVRHVAEAIDWAAGR